MSFFDGQPRCLAVFSHPNHEIAVIETLKRLGAHLCFLTDGGGQKRIAESEKGLRQAGLLDRAVFLGWPEAAFYDAILRTDADFFSTVARSVRAIAQLLDAERILCDAVEYYNPVHDMTLPIVRCASWGCIMQPTIYGVPLVYEPEGHPGGAVLQSAPAGQPRLEFRLEAGETAEKLRLFRDTYTILHAAFGPLVQEGVPALSVETLLTDTERRPRPPGYELRYERRAKELLEQGKVEQAILYLHYAEAMDGLEGKAL